MFGTRKGLEQFTVIKLNEYGKPIEFGKPQEEKNVKCIVVVVVVVVVPVISVVVAVVVAVAVAVVVVVAVVAVAVVTVVVAVVLAVVIAVVAMVVVVVVVAAVVAVGVAVVVAVEVVKTILLQLPRIRPCCPFQFKINSEAMIPLDICLGSLKGRLVSSKASERIVLLDFIHRLVSQKKLRNKNIYTKKLQYTRQKFTQGSQNIWSVNHKVRDNLKDLGVDGF
jgi:hypothetical protein